MLTIEGGKIASSTENVIFSPFPNGSKSVLDDSLLRKGTINFHCVKNDIVFKNDTGYVCVCVCVCVCTCVCVGCGWSSWRWFLVVTMTKEAATDTQVP